MEIELAKFTGFCFGVNRVIDMINAALAENKKICTLGQVIHNKNMVDELENKGVRVIKNVNEARDNEIIVIRSHGIEKNIYNQLKNKNFLDGTCPFVNKIHKIVSSNFIDQNTKEIINCNNIFIIIIGDKNHPEVKGIEGNCIYDFVTILNSNELKNYINNKNKDLNQYKYIKVVCQTTYDVNEFSYCSDIIKSSFKDYEIFNTICSETKKRQREANTLSKTKDLIIVVGGKNSSNTRKLFELCTNNCNTVWVESSSDLDKYSFFKDGNKHKKIGVVAGASTSLDIIKSVIKKLENNNGGEI